ncbi:MAG TPA: YitT family protein [Chitinophagaceae bacterium]|jgi:uncharacterized membrane-anchored protein YitT (DUF2179 family)|nr:YitT family protein [Chitinophagaceae bacterium]
MNPQFINIIRLQIQKAFGKTDKHSLTRYMTAKKVMQGRKKTLHAVRDMLFMLTGVLSAGFGLKGFLIPNNFIDGGVMGISLLIHEKTNFTLAFLIIIINLPFIILGWQQINKAFSIKSAAAISLLAIAVAVIPYPIVTNDKLLIAVFGGFFLGAGIGLTIRGGGVIDGTEILAIFFNRKSSLSVGDFILLFNIAIFSVAAYLLSVEIALYSILIYLAASKTVDFILEGIEEFTGIIIISPRNKEIADMIRTKLRRGLTIYSGKKGYGKSGETYHSTEIIFTVITRLEISKLNAEIEKIDPNAFIVMHSIKDTRGGMVKKRPLKE